MSMTGAWIYTKGTRSGRWANIPLLGIEDAGGIPSAEWNNLTTGSGLLLFPDGTWNHSGHFHLFFKGAGSEQASQVDALLAPADPHYPASPTAWRGVWRRCVDYVNHLVGGEVVVLEEFAQEWRVSMEARWPPPAATSNCPTPMRPYVARPTPPRPSSATSGSAGWTNGSPARRAHRRARRPGQPMRSPPKG